MDDDIDFSEDDSKPKTGWLMILVVAAWLGIWTAANINTVRADVIMTRSLDIGAIEKCRLLNYSKPGTYVWNFKYGCQLKIQRRDK